MEGLRYHRDKPLLGALLGWMFLLSAVLMIGGEASRGEAPGLVEPVFAAIGAYGIWRAVRLRSAPALEVEADGITLHTLGPARHMPWRTIGSIDLHKGHALRLFWVIPVFPVHYLVVRRPGSPTMRILLWATDLPAPRYRGYVAALERHRLEMGLRTDAPAGTAEFDPDAAIARYLAREGASPAPVAQPVPEPGTAATARPAFGRKR